MIRTFCDHCGLEIGGPPQHYMFGPVKSRGRDEDGYEFDEPDEYDEAEYEHPTIPSRAGDLEPIRIQLCTRCAPIWMKRVHDMTETSEPKPKKTRAKVK